MIWRLNIENPTMLYYDNAPCHKAISVNRYLTIKNIFVQPQTPYSFTRLEPCKFFFFPQLKIHLKGRHFGILKNIQTSVTDEPKTIPVSQFQSCYEHLKYRLQRYVDYQSISIEGENVK